MEKQEKVTPKRERNSLALELKEQPSLDTMTQPTLIIQSPKTPTLSRKLKAVSLDAEPPTQSINLEVSRDVFSMPNTPKRQLKPKLSCDFDDGPQKSTLTPHNVSNLKKFASNTSISGSQTLKTLPEITALQDFSDSIAAEPMKFKAKGLLERRGSTASLTIDLGSNSNIAEKKPVTFSKLNTAKSVSNLCLSSFETTDKQCHCLKLKKCDNSLKLADRRKSQEACGNCIIYESHQHKMNGGKKYPPPTQCSCCAKSRRKSLSNENLYVPPCGFCQTGATRNCTGNSKHCKGYRKAYYPRQTDVDTSQFFADDFKLHLQNIQYLQTAGNLLTVSDLQHSCEAARVPKLHQEFWEVPLNLQEKCYVSGSQSRNRYRGVLPNEHSRVHLSTSQNYIHANYIKGPDFMEANYIATQGPMAHTCEDFWEMVWSSHCKCIVMLTGLIEKGRSKCELYFPLGKDDDKDEKSFYFLTTTKVRDKFSFDTNNFSLYETETHAFEELNEITFGPFRIKYMGKRLLDDCHVRKLEVKKSTSNESRIIHHYWFANWPDHKMANPEQVLKIALDVLEIMDNFKKYDNNARDISNNNHESQKGVVRKSDIPCKSSVNDSEKNISKKGSLGFPLFKKSGLQERRKSSEAIQLPVVVHCSAGIGRTGCFLAILNGIQQLKTNTTVDVLGILCSLRLNRGGMVQTAEQYELIHRVLSLFAETLVS